MHSEMRHLNTGVTKGLTENDRPYRYGYLVFGYFFVRSNARCLKI